MSSLLPAILEADRQLALAYCPSREAAAALFRIDAHLARIALTTHEPVLAQIKLAWWREEGFLARAGATELAADVGLVTAAMTGGATRLGDLADGWAAIADGSADRRGEALFGAVAAMNGLELSEPQAHAAEAWGAADLALLTGDAERLAGARARACDMNPAVFTRPLTSLGVMTLLARHNVVRGLASAWGPGSPKRIARAFWFALTSR